MADQPKHLQAKLYPSEIVTLALVFALKGLGSRPFYRWLSRNYRSWFPGLPHRTRLFRLHPEGTHTHHARAEIRSRSLAAALNILLKMDNYSYSMTWFEL
jgi:hypothetical protein